MAFGFFRKKNCADSIFINAKLVTDDEELKNCTWIAVKDERILAIGESDYYTELKGKDTAVYDLEGRYVAPGLIDAFADLSAGIMKDSFIPVSPDASEDEILDTVARFASNEPDAPYCLICGASMKLFKGSGSEGKEEEENSPSFLEKLDKASGELPTVIMFEDGMSLRLNTAASEAVTQRADEMMIHTISPEFALDTVVSTDFIAQAKILTEKMFDCAAKGCTGAFTCAQNSYFDKLCRDLLIDAASCDMLKQRCFGAFPLKRMFNPSSVFYSMNKAKTDCTELNGKINYVNLFINSSSSEDNYNYMSEKYLEQLCSDAADKGYNIRIKTNDKTALISAVNVLGNLSNQYKKLSFTVMHDEDLSDEEKSTLFFGELNDCPAGGISTAGLYGDALLKALTLDAARFCGASSDLGSIEEGKLADFAVFDEDPAAFSDIAELNKKGAYMTVLSGVPVYTRGKDSPEDWLSVISEHLGSVAEFCEV